jgi:hypothetical protein
MPKEKRRIFAALHQTVNPTKALASVLCFNTLFLLPTGDLPAPLTVGRARTY